MDRAECWQETDLEEKVVHFTKYDQNRFQTSEDYRGSQDVGLFHLPFRNFCVNMVRKGIHSSAVMAAFPFGRKKEKRNLK